MTKLFLLDWNNGLDYGDNEVTLLGVYSSRKQLEQAKERFQRQLGKRWPFMREEGKFVEAEIELNGDLV